MNTTKYIPHSRFLALFLAFVMLLSTTSCAAPTKHDSEQERFNSYIKTLPAEFYPADSLNLNFTFRNPQDFGIEQEPAVLPFNTKEDWDSGMEETQEILDTLHSFDLDKLDESSQLTLLILEDFLSRQLMLQDYYYLDNSYLGSFIGFQAELPLLLNEYHLESKQDLDSYYNLLTTAEDTFIQYAEMEKARQEEGVGMCQPILDKIIGQCRIFANGNVDFLIESISEKIDNADFLNDEEKSAAKEKCEKLLKNDLRNAYRTLGSELSKIDAPEEMGGLATQPNGKEYYEVLLQVGAGIDMSVPEVKKYLENKLDSLMFEMQLSYMNLHKKYPEKFEQLYSPDYGDFASAEETLEYLKTACAQDYPDVPDLKYEVTQVPESMSENFSPAAYLTSRIDEPEDYSEAIYINGEFSPSLFTTVAHEGYPGHMYQNAYFKSLDLPAARYLVYYKGYSEGWATYIERNSISYVPTEDREFLEFLELNDSATSIIIALSDIGIHYEGWTKEEYYDFMRTYLGDLDEDTLNDQYLLNLETPTNYLQYYLTGFLYQDLYNMAEEKMGSDFSSIEFNRILLETGPAPYSIIKDQVCAWAGIEDSDKDSVSLPMTDRDTPKSNKEKKK